MVVVNLKSGSEKQNLNAGAVACVVVCSGAGVVWERCGASIKENNEIHQSTPSTGHRTSAANGQSLGKMYVSEGISQMGVEAAYISFMDKFYGRLVSSTEVLCPEGITIFFLILLLAMNDGTSFPIFASLYLCSYFFSAVCLLVGVDA